MLSDLLFAKKAHKLKDPSYLVVFLNQAIPITATVIAAMTAIGFMV